MGDTGGGGEKNAFETEDRPAVQKQKKRALQSYSDFDVFERELGDAIDMDAGKASLRRRIFIMFDEPDSSIAAKLIGTVVMVLILAGTVTFCAESMYCVGLHHDLDSCDAAERSTLEDLKLFETVCLVAFTIEYVARVCTCTARLSPDPSILKYVVKPMNLIDLAAILPFYIELFLGGCVVYNEPYIFVEIKVHTISSCAQRGWVCLYSNAENDASI